MNRFFTRPEIIETYRLPRHVHDQLFAEVVPVEKTDQDEPLFLEAHHVDSWLDAGSGSSNTSPPKRSSRPTRKLLRFLGHGVSGTSSWGLSRRAEWVISS